MPFLTISVRIVAVAPFFYEHPTPSRKYALNDHFHTVFLVRLVEKPLSKHRSVISSDKSTERKRRVKKNPKMELGISGWHPPQTKCLLVYNLTLLLPYYIYTRIIPYYLHTTSEHEYCANGKIPLYYRFACTENNIHNCN